MTGDSARGILNGMQSIFFNQRRLRAGWRILLFLALLVALISILGAPLAALFPDLEAATAMGKLSLLLDGYLLVPLLLASWLMLRFVDRRPFASLGLNLKASGGKEFFTGILIGLAMGAVFMSVGLAAGLLRVRGGGPGGWEDLVILIGGFLLAAAFEETLFHGYPFQTLIEGIGIYPSIFLVSVVFSLFHRANPNFNLIGSINIGLAGLLLALGYLKTRALLLPIGVHFAWNLFQVLFSLPVSGIAFSGGPLRLEADGPELLTGGAFGPEGSIITTVIFFLTIVGLILSRRIRPSLAMERLWKEHIHPALSKELEF